MELWGSKLRVSETAGGQWLVTLFIKNYHTNLYIYCHSKTLFASLHHFMYL